MAAFETKEYRNIFAEIGKNKEEIDKKIKDAVNVFFFGDEVFDDEIGFAAVR